MTTGFWEVVIPEAGTNLAYNPAATITGNLTAIGATAGTAVSRVTTYSYIGPACHRITSSTDNEGGYFTLKAAANAIHYVTLRIHSASDIDAFDVSMDNTNWHDMTLLSTEGSWWVYGAQIPAAQANASVALRVQQKGAGAIDLYIGFAQVEQNTYATTPISGGLTGFYLSADGSAAGYAWEGSPNASASTRSAQERAGGRVVDLQDTYNCKVRWSTGIGMPPVQHHTQAQAQLPGMRYMGFKVLPRAIDLEAVMGTSYVPAAVHSVRKNIVAALDLDAAATAQPVKLRYRGQLSTKPVEYNCVYDTGLDMGGRVSDFTERTAIRLICYDPYAYEIGEASAQLTTSLSIANADYAVKRIAGTWSNITTALDGIVSCFAKAANGNTYIGGQWAADVSTAGDGYGIGIIEYNPTTGALTSLGTGLGGNKDVFGMVVDANGDLYIVGDFLNAGGVAAADYCAYWDISAGAWVAMSSGLGGIGNCIVIDNTGNFYIGGAFTNLVDANGDYITKWNRTSFSSLGSGLNDECKSMAIGKDGYLYFGGEFSASGATTLNGIGVYDGTSISALGTGLASVGSYVCWAIAVDSAGRVYFGGTFDSVNGVTASNIAVYNGSAFEPLGSGANGIAGSIVILDGRSALVSGAFTVIGGITTSSAIWNGYSWGRVPFTPAGAGTIYTALVKGDNLYFGVTTAGTATSSYLNTITNSGSARAYPVIHIKREGGTSATIQWLKNETTGATIYLNYALLDGEELVLDFRTGQRKIVSSFFGNVWRSSLRGSAFGDFYLQKGANSISAYVAQVGSPTMTQYLLYQVTHLSADGAAA